MGVNKVIYDGDTLMDITDSTVTEETLMEGAVAYNAAGERIVGGLSPVLYTPQELTEKQKAQARENIGAMEAATPQMFGAIGDGVADDTNSIKQAILAAADTLYVPNGTYRLTDSLVLNAPISVIGEREAVFVFENLPEIEDAAFLDINAEGCRLESLVIRGNSANRRLVNINNRAEIIGCEFDGLCAMTDWTGDSSGTNIINLNNGSDNTIIRDCYIHNAFGGLIDGFHNRVKPMVDLKNLVIENNILHDSDTGDVIALCASDSRIVGNNIFGKWQNCIVIHADTGSNCERIEVERNTINVDLDRQYTQAGYGLAFRPSDDNLYSCVDCKAVNNHFGGWGNSHNGSQGIMIHTGCLNTLVSGNTFRGNIPENGYCIANYAIDTTISDNIIAIESGTAIGGIEMFAGSGRILRNIVSNATERTCIVVSNNTDGNHLICDNVVSGKNGIGAVKNDIVKSNRISATQRGIIVGGKAKAIGNHIESTKVGIYIDGTADGVFVSDNRVIINGGTYGIQCQGANVSIKNNYVEGVTAAIAGISNTGIITIDGNTCVNAPIQVSSAGATYWVTDNDCGGKHMAISNVALTLFAYNNRNYTFMSNVANAKRVENGVAKQAASPTSSDAANVWGNQYDLVKKYDLVVEDTSATPYQRYVLRSDNTWEAVSNESGGGSGDAGDDGNLLDIASDGGAKYINGSGDLVASSSWRAYFLDATKIAAITRLSLWSNSTTFYAIAFYSSATPSASTFISGKLFTNMDSAGLCVFTDIPIPENAVLAVFSNRTASSGAIEAIGVKLDTIYLKSPNGTKFMITVSNDGVLTATEVTA